MKRALDYLLQTRPGNEPFTHHTRCVQVISGELIDDIQGVVEF